MTKTVKEIIYGVYKLGIASSENEFSYYMYCRYKNILLLKDGTCSVDLTDYQIPEASMGFFGDVIGEGFIKGSYCYPGYEMIDSLFSNCVTKNIEQYEYESGATGE